MAPDGAEAPGVQAGQVVGAEAAHRNATDGDAPAIGVEQRDRPWDHLAHHVGAPLARDAVMPVGVISAVGEDDVRCPGAEPLERGEQLVAQLRILVIAAAVQEDEQWASSPPSPPGSRGSA
jgi:hypothetical protein